MGIGQEIVYRVAKTPRGYKVTRFDGHGLREGLMSKSEPRYFYGDDAEERAHEYAERKARKASEDDRNGRVVRLGETWEERREVPA